MQSVKRIVKRGNEPRLDTQMTQHKLLCLDLGVTTGWAILTGRDQVFSGTVQWQGTLSRRLYDFWVWLGQRMAVEEIVYERPFAKMDKANASLHGMAGVVLMSAYDHEVPVTAYAPKELKKLITGKGNATKQEMVEAIVAKHGKVHDHNEADALALLEAHRMKT